MNPKSTPLIRQFSAGGAVYKETKSGSKWLLINPLNTDRWQLPKGKIETGENSKQAAQREVQEEGGVFVDVMSKVGEQKYFFYLDGKKVLKTVIYYLMKYKLDNPIGIDKKEIEKIRFVEIGKALELLSYDNDKEIIQKASNLLKTTGNRG